MLEIVKLALRVKGTAFDAEIFALVAAAVADLIAVGVDASEATDNARIKQAIVLYCKAYFGYDNPNAERYRVSYEMLRISLALDGGVPDVG